MPVNMTITVYHFDELSADAKDKAREWFRAGYPDFEWYDFVYEDAKTIGALMGVRIDHIYFSGFSSQGDGACFTGRSEYAKGSTRKLADYAPNETELHRIARELAAIQRRNLYQLSAGIKHVGRYYHARNTSIDVYRNDGRNMTSDAEDAITEALRDFMDWIYKRLEAEYEYLLSDEQVDQTIGINAYTFNAKGQRFPCHS